MSAASAVVDDDVVDLVRNVFERVGDAFEMLVDFPRDDEAQRVGLAVALEGLLEPRRVDLVGKRPDPLAD